MQTSIDLTEPCIDAGFGYENKDGYVRICNVPRNLGGKLVMRHRWFWETYVGPIPEGYEINHLCKNRRCFNIRHLECIDGTEHAIKGNVERYKEDYLEFKKLYAVCFEDKVFSQKEWGEMMNRSQACISKWINKIKSEVTY